MIHKQNDNFFFSAIHQHRMLLYYGTGNMNWDYNRLSFTCSQSVIQLTCCDWLAVYVSLYVVTLFVSFILCCCNWIWVWHFNIYKSLWTVWLGINTFGVFVCSGTKSLSTWFILNWPLYILYSRYSKELSWLLWSFAASHFIYHDSRRKRKKKKIYKKWRK